MLFDKKILAKHILFYLIWLLLIKFLAAMLDVINMHSSFTILLLQAIMFFCPLWLTLIKAVVIFVIACFNGSITKFPLNYAELKIIAFTVCYIGYVNILRVLSKWLNGMLINIFTGETLAYSLPKEFLIEYIFSIINDTDSGWYFLLLPLYIVLVILKLQLQTLSQR